MTDGPADKTKHTPSPRHTLEEVLHSLQDLLRNDLQGMAAQADPAAVHADKLPDLPTPVDVITQLEGSLAALESAEHDTQYVPHEDTALTLKDLAQPPPMAPENLPPTSAPRPGGKALTNRDPDRHFASEAIQQQLSFSDPATSIAEKMPIVQVPDMPKSFTAGDRNDYRQSRELQPHTSVEACWDDIPVLENAIDLVPGSSSTPAHASMSTVSEPASREPVPPPPATLPSADAHRIAILAAARLDLELRKSGERSLDTAVVARLAQILEEMLAQGTAIMDNISPK